MPKRVYIDELMLGSAVRYALTRSTYIVAATAQEVKKSWDELSLKTQQIIKRDVVDAVKAAEAAGKTVGMSMDHETWVDLINYMETNS